MHELKCAFLNDKKTYGFQSKQELLRFVRNKKKILVAINAEKILLDSSKLTGIINENIGYPDGIGAVLALKRKGVPSIKIAGAEFWLDILKEYHKEKSVYLIGSSQQVIERTVANLKTSFPTINIVGFRDGFLKEGDKEALVKVLEQLKPDIVFVAMGSPRQELLMDKLIAHHPALYMGLGGSFDVYTGLKKRAPAFYQKLGLEWFYRLLKEPTRLGRQLSLVKFLFKVIFNKL